MNSISKSTIDNEKCHKLELTDEDLDELYSWVDLVPLSRPKKNFARDFSDAVLCAELVSFFMPKEVDMIFYMPSCCSSQKKSNWKMLNQNVLSKFGIKLSETQIMQLVEAKAGVIEEVIWEIRTKLPNSDPTKVKPKRKPSARNLGFLPNVQSKKSVHVPVRPASSTPLSFKPVKIEKVIEVSAYPDENCNFIVDNDNGVVPLIKQANKRNTSIEKKLKTRKQAQEYNNSKSLDRGIHLPTRGKSVPCTNVRPPTVKSSATKLPMDPPIVNYGGVKMIPVSVLEDKEQVRKNLEVENKDLESKLHRLERLADVKDQRVEDLTNQLHELHDLYERVNRAEESMLSSEMVERC